MKYFIILILGASFLSEILALEPTPIVNNGIFALQNQHDGKYLTVGDNGQFLKAEFGGSKNQKFTFNQLSADQWTLTPLTDNPNYKKNVYIVKYVGHGKRQFKNSATNLCLGGVSEIACNDYEPLQRWFVEKPSA